MAERLNELENWVLAKVIGGDNPALPSDMGARAAALAGQLLALPARDREYMARRYLTPSEIADVLGVVSEAAPPAPKPEKPYAILSWQQLQALPPLRWIIDKEIPEQGLIVIFGESGIGKSFVSIDYALRIAQSSNVVYIPTEGTAGYLKRVSAWSNHHKQPIGNIHFVVGNVNIYDKEGFRSLQSDLLPLKPRLMVVDTLAMAMAGADENSARDMGIVLQSCRVLQHSTGAAVILVHHVGKAGASERGSSALRGNADVMIRVSAEDDLIKVDCSKTKDEEPFATRYMKLLPVETVHGQSLVVEASARIVQTAGSVTRQQRALLNVLALEVNLQSGAPMRELQEVTGLSLGTTQRALSTMMKLGYVSKAASGSYVITDSGKALLSDPTDPKVIQPVIQNGFYTTEGKNAVRSTDPTDPRNSARIKSDALLDHVDQLDHRSEGWISVDQGESQPSLFGTDTPPSKRRSHYDFGG